MSQSIDSNKVFAFLSSRIAAVAILLVSTLYPVEAFSANCATQSPLVCLDSTPCKNISGVNVCLSTVNPLPAGALRSKEACWSAQGSYTCADPLVINDGCATLKADKTCGVTSSVVSMTDPVTGAPSVYTDTYQCQTGGGLTATSTDCSGLTYCADGSCFTKKDKPNDALAKVVTAMELSRQAGFYQDPATMRIFKGDAAYCTTNTMGLANCCKPNAKGASMNDALLADLLIRGGWDAWTKTKVGSSYTFDVLYDKVAGYVDRAISGMSEVVNQSAEAGANAISVTPTATPAPSAPTPTTQASGASVGGMIGGTGGTMLGSKFAANNGGNTFWQGVGGAAGYAGGTVLGTYAGAYAQYGLQMASSALTGGAAPTMAQVAINWEAIAVMVVIMIIMAMLACAPNEIKTQLKLGAGLCHEVGAACSAKALGTCMTMRHNQCCFNSKLAKIVQEQGRPQIGKTWGAATAPDCSGFTVDELQTLDFSKMDLSEFFADVTAKAVPDPAKLGSDVQKRLNDFYAATPSTAMNGVIPSPSAGTPVALTVTQVSQPVAPAAMPCDVAINKLAPAANGDQTGTFTVSSCLAGGLTDWAYTGNCPALLGSTPGGTQIDANGATSWTTTVPASCLAAATPAMSNFWSVRVFDSATGQVSSTFQANF